MSIKEQIKKQEEIVKKSRLEVTKAKAELETIEAFFDKMSSTSSSSLFSMVVDFNAISAINHINSSNLESEYRSRAASLNRQIFSLERTLKSDETKLDELKNQEENLKKGKKVSKSDAEKIEKLNQEILETEKSLLKNEFNVESYSTQIEILKKLRDEVSSNRTTSSISMITNFNPMAALNYSQNSSILSDIDKKISSINSRKWSSESSLYSDKRHLTELLSKLDYFERTEVKLVEKDGQIYIKGDASKTDILKDVKDLLNGYVAEFNNLKGNQNVQNFIKLRKKLSEISKDENIPVVSPEILRYAEAIKKYNPEIDYECLIVNDKLFTNVDFISLEKSRISKENEYYKAKIKRAEERTESFNPTFIGKVFKSVGKRQKDKFIADNREYFAESQIERNERENKNLERLQETYIKPVEKAMPIMQEIGEILRNSPEVQKYINESSGKDKIISENEILKTLNITEIKKIISPLVNQFLDENMLRINEDELMKLISKSKSLTELNQEIIKATGYKFPEKTKEVGVQMQ